MSEKEANMAAMVLSTIGVLCFIAFGLGVLAFKWGVFGGIACFIIAGLVRCLGKQG